MLRGIWLAAIGIAACLVLVPSAQAALLLEFAVSGTPPVISVPSIGSTVPVEVYLRQTGTTTILTDEGLATAGIKVAFADPTVAAVESVGDIQENPLFDDALPFSPIKTVSATEAVLSESIASTSSAVYPSSGDSDRVWLGTFTFTGLSVGTTSISVSDLSGGDDFLTGVLTPLDGLITAGQADLTVESGSAAVPEPGGTALGLAIFAAALTVTFWRSRRLKLAANSS